MPYETLSHWLIMFATLHYQPSKVSYDFPYRLTGKAERLLINLSTG